MKDMISREAVLDVVREEMPTNRMDTDEEVAMERLYHRIIAKIEGVPSEKCNLTFKMEGQNMTEADVLEYMKLKELCVLKGYTLKSLLEARAKQEQKKPYSAIDNNRYRIWVNCPCCQQSLAKKTKCCPTCGQKLDWKGR